MRKRKWLRWIFSFLLVVVIASAAFSRALRTDAARRYLIAHLVASFGRPVEVARFDFSLLDGARLEAQSITVAEDPHFGNEYFLRADTLTAGIRWSALLSGRFEFGTLSFSRPSLNLTRDADGRWNIESWLPPASLPGSRPGFVGPLPAPQVAHLYRIQIDGGRINFKQLDDKTPFALLDVSGQVDQDGAGRWQLDLEARPMRAGVELQDIGMLRLQGTIAGTSARLQPAELHLTWRDASLADTLRLAREQDYGMRGELSMDLDAKIGPPSPVFGFAAASGHGSSPESSASSGASQWSISGAVRMTGIHSWTLPEKGDDPAANVWLDASWQLGERRAQIQKVRVEMPGSHLEGTGDLDWEHGFHPQFHIETSSVGLNDILSWYRALHPDVAEDLHAQGTLGVDVTLGGWPMLLQQGAIASVGGTLTGASLPTPLQIGAMNASVSSGGLDFAPTQISLSTHPANESDDPPANLADDSNTFILRGSIFPDTNAKYRLPLNWNLSIEGSAPRVEDWLSLSSTLAVPINRGWTATGGLAVKLRGSRRAGSSATSWLGIMDFRGLTLSPEQVNQPVSLTRAHVEFTPLQRTIALGEVEALGSSWQGTIARKNSDPQWTFDLTANRIDVAQLDQWLGPRARPGFLARFTGLGNSDAGATPKESAVTQMVARGRLRAGEIVISPLRLDQFDGETEVDGRTIRIQKAQADFFGGKVAGTLDAKILADPTYEFQGRFDRVSLSQLGRSVTFLTNRIAGTASGTISISTHGIGHQALMTAMVGNGMLNAKNADLSGINLAGLFSGDDPDPPADPFSSIQGTFRIRTAGIDVANFVLDQPRGRLRADGRIEFTHALNLRILPSILQAATSPAVASPPGYLLTGTIESPKLALPDSAPKPTSGSGNRRR